MANPQTRPVLHSVAIVTKTITVREENRQTACFVLSENDWPHDLLLTATIHNLNTGLSRYCIAYIRMGSFKARFCIANYQALVRNDQLSHIGFGV